MNDLLLFAIGALVSGLMVVGIALTFIEFRAIPKRQAPEFKEVAFQAQPERRKKGGRLPAEES